MHSWPGKYICLISFSFLSFEGAIAVAGGDPNLWSVKGGNMRVAEELLKHSHATLLKRKVKEIMLNEDGNFMVSLRENAISVY